MINSLEGILEILSFSPEATAIYDNQDLRIAYVNDKMLAIWGREDDIVGDNFGQVFPAFTQQGFTNILKDVWKSGTTYTDVSVPVDVLIGGELQLSHFDFEYRAILKNGQTYAILHTAKEVSDRKMAFDALEEKERVQKELNEELAVTNEELLASNEEIQAYSEEHQMVNEKLHESLLSLETSYLDLQTAHRQLAVAEEKARIILDNALVAVGVIDTSTFVLESANKLLLEIWAINESCIGQPLQQIIHGGMLIALQSLTEQVIASGQPLSLNDMNIHEAVETQGLDLFYNFSFQPLKDKRGVVVAVMVVANDVTSQRNEKVEVDYQLEQAKLAKFATKLGIFDLDLKLHSFSCDERCREILSPVPDAVVDYRRDFLEKIHVDDKERVFAEIKHSFEDSDAEGKFMSIHRLVEADTQAEIWVQLYGQVYFDVEKKATRFIGTIKDVTEATILRHNLEESERNLMKANEEIAAALEELTASNEEILSTNEELLQSQKVSDEYFDKLQYTNQQLSESEDRLNVAIEGAELGIWDVDLLHGIVNWDQRTRELFGLDANEPIVHKDIWNNVHAEDRERVEQEVARSKRIQSKGVFNSQFRTAEREGRNSSWLQLKGKVHFDKTDIPVRFSGTVLDITERIIAQQQADSFNQAIEKKDIEQRMIVEAGGIGTFSYDIQTKVVTTNALIRKHLNLDNYRELYTDKIFKYNLDNNPSSTERLLLNTIIEESSFDTEFQLSAESSKNSKWLRVIGQKVTNSDGGDTVYGVMIDITAQKLEEKRKLDFLGIVSHELKSPLTSLSGYLQILEVKSRKLQEEQFSSLLSSASRQTTRIKLLIEGFLDVARYGEGKLKLNSRSFQISHLFEEIEKTYQETVATHRLIFDMVFQGEIYADKDKIEQVIINLINNAIKYAPIDTTVTIHCTVMDNMLHIEVKDEGPGIKAEDQQKIFDRFYRVENDTTELISGFGIGLYICNEIVKLHQGSIGVQSEISKGTTFWFKLPFLSSETV